jgi:hypothetical protein
MVAVCPRRSEDARGFCISVIAALLSKAQATEKTTAARMGAKQKRGLPRHGKTVPQT